MHSFLFLLPFLALAVKADVITDLKEGMVENGKSSGIRKLSLLGDTDNKLISTSFVSINQCPDEFVLGSPCVTFKLAKEGQLDDMSDHPGNARFPFNHRMASLMNAFGTQVRLIDSGISLHLPILTVARIVGPHLEVKYLPSYTVTPLSRRLVEYDGGTSKRSAWIFPSRTGR